MPRLFVYGTLRRGESNHFMLASGAVFVRADRTLPVWTLHDLGEYPALVAGGCSAVEGEVFEVPEELLIELDAFEGVPELFVRAWIVLGSAERVVAYTMPAERAGSAPEVRAGRWR
jgi:gamma-glutamylcyclotransferase (GGCT)/AIG2-like uncharacterized protein YtfP